MQTNSHIEVPEHILSEQLDQETVLLDMNSGYYFGLNPVASRMWNLLREGKSFQQCIAILQQEYVVDEPTLLHDIQQLIQDLASRNIIRSTSPQA